jgi:large subunit ribosomal protein L22
MTATKTNERPGTRATLANSNMAPNKVREVLNLIRDVEYDRASDILAHTDRAAAAVVAKLLHSCAANAEHNDGLDPAELYVATCYADEGTTLKRWRPRARGRATRIRKRSCHITIILARMPDEKIARRRARVAAEAADRRARRVAGTRRRETSSQSSAAAADEAVVADGLIEDADELSAVEAPATDVVEVETAETTTDAATTDAETTDDATAVAPTEVEAAEDEPEADEPEPDAVVADEPAVEDAESGAATDDETPEEDGN